MSEYMKTRLNEMTQAQIKLMNGSDEARIQELKNARAVLVTLKNQYANVNMINAELARLGA